MVICIIAFVVLAFMGIFSAKYRRWAKEAFSCVTRMVTLRPCETGFDDKVKAAITSVIMRRHEGLARFTHRHFKAISWAFVIIFFLSLAQAGYSVYNLAVFGTCDPVTGNCVFNPGGDPNRVVCPYEGLNPAASVPTIGGFRSIESAKTEGRPAVYFFGTTWCPHCAWERPIFMSVTNKFADYIDVKKTEIDLTPNSPDMVVFNHYSPEGKIPLIVIGGKYFRVGSGDAFGEQAEANTLTAILCKVTGNPIDDCSSDEIKQMISRI